MAPLQKRKKGGRASEALQSVTVQCVRRGCGRWRGAACGGQETAQRRGRRPGGLRGPGLTPWLPDVSLPRKITSGFKKRPPVPASLTAALSGATRVRAPSPQRCRQLGAVASPLSLRLSLRGGVLCLQKREENRGCHSASGRRGWSLRGTGSGFERALGPREGQGARRAEAGRVTQCLEGPGVHPSTHRTRHGGEGMSPAGNNLLAGCFPAGGRRAVAKAEGNRSDTPAVRRGGL